MAAPTQQFPPWLTPSPSVITDAGGFPITTSTTIVYLPLTYFGPSVPLGSLFTFGGSTSPASTATAASETTVESTSITNPPTTASTATPTSSLTSLPSSTATSTSSISSLTSSVSLSTSFNPSASSSLSSSTSQSAISTSSPSSSASSLPTASGGLGRGQLIGVIVGSILGLIFLFVFALALYLWCKGRPNRQSTRFSMVTPIDEDYFIVAPGGRSPGEGSPRHSGEEADPFLQRSRSALGSTEMREVGALPGRRRPPGAEETSFSTVETNNARDIDSISNASGYGNIIERPSLGLLPSMQEEAELRGSILSPEELRRLDRESVLPPDDPYAGEGVHAYTALLPPPRLVDPETASRRSLDRVLKPASSQQSLDNPEAATLLTARRVKMEDLARASPLSPRNKELPAEPSTSRVSGGLLGSLGLGGLASLNRMSWFRGTDSPRSSRHSASYTAAPLTDDDLESGRAAYLTPPPTRRSRRVGAGLGPEGDRPISNVSARSARSNASGGTVYHDANSSIPSTPVMGLAPPPRAVTPPDVPSQQETTHWPSTTTMQGPPAYELFDGHTTSHSRGPSTTNLNQNALPPPKFDVLDLPAPTALTSFTSSSSLHGATSNSTIGTKLVPFPPGLEILATPKAWTEMSTGATPSPGSFAGIASHDNAAGISIDVLEEAPPSAGDGWRSLATVGFPEGRRTTFGLPQLVHSPELVSEQGSLHSMRSHLSPTSSRSTGSAPASRRDLSGSLGSGHSQAKSGSSGLSLARTGSISSDERRRSGPMSPALSAFGPRGADGNLSPVVGSPVSAHLSPHRVSRSTEPSSPLSAASHLNIPWAGGLDQDWTPR